MIIHKLGICDLAQPGAIIFIYAIMIIWIGLSFPAYRCSS